MCKIIEMKAMFAPVSTKIKYNPSNCCEKPTNYMAGSINMKKYILNNDIQDVLINPLDLDKLKDKDFIDSPHSSKRTLSSKRAQTAKTEVRKLNLRPQTQQSNNRPIIVKPNKMPTMPPVQISKINHMRTKSKPSLDAKISNINLRENTDFDTDTNTGCKNFQYEMPIKRKIVERCYSASNQQNTGRRPKISREKTMFFKRSESIRPTPDSILQIIRDIQNDIVKNTIY